MAPLDNPPELLTSDDDAEEEGEEEGVEGWSLVFEVSDAVPGMIALKNSLSWDWETVGVEMEVEVEVEVLTAETVLAETLLSAFKEIVAAPEFTMTTPVVFVFLTLLFELVPLLVMTMVLPNAMSWVC
jgi:hypothetical protein